MKNFRFLLGMLLAAALVMGGSESLTAATAVKKSQNNQRDAVQRTGSLFDLQQNTVSNIQFYTTNYGIFGLNVSGNAGGGFWPRNSGRAYIFGGGVWFGALKFVDNPTVPNKLVIISYNPNSGLSWLAPGRVSDGEAIQNNIDAIRKYRTYFSTDFDVSNGEPLNRNDGPNWPVWDTDFDETLKRDRYLGNYVHDIDERNQTANPKGPAFISQEDIFAVYKDTDLTLYEGGADLRRRRGYPMNLDIEQNIYSWGFGDYKDFIFIAYNITNRSDEPLLECFMAPAMDMDIALQSNQRNGADNDRTRFYDEEEDLNFAVQWSEGNRGENGQGFGYIGFDFLESPAVDEEGNIRTDKKFYDNEEQLGLATFRNWVIQNDPTTDEERYDFISARVKDGDTERGDKRFLMATGPFNLQPGQTARVVVGIIIASAATDAGRKTVPDGSTEDLAELVRKDKFAQTVYDDNFRAPVPPIANRLSWEPVNNGVVVRWDTLSELSVDSLEDGLDFFGYRLYRARRVDLDTFDIDQISPSLQYSNGKGPFGWKQVAEFVMPTPFVKDSLDALAASEFNVQFERSPALDSLHVLSLDNAARTYRVVRFASGIFPILDPNTGNWRSDLQAQGMNSRGFFAVPTLPWFDYFKSIDDQPDGFERLSELLVGNVVVTDPSVELVAANDPGIQDTMYAYMQRGVAIAEFVPFGDATDVKEYGMRLMDSVTNNFTFVDIGDDNGDGVITETVDLTTTERLINNVDYFYSMLAFDEGDYNQRTPGKFNSRIKGRNEITAIPFAARAREDLDIEVSMTPQDSAGIGGVYNFRLEVLDEERMAQLYSGHEFEVEFRPVWLQVGQLNVIDGGETRTYTNLGLYARDVVLTDVTEDKELVRFPAYNFSPSNIILGSYSENGVVYTGGDTLGVGVQDATNASVVARGGTFESSASSRRWAPNQFINGTFGLKFDHYIQQYGGAYRPFTSAVVAADGNAPDTHISWSEEVATVQAGAGGLFTGFNNGPGVYEVEFLPGGSGEIMDITVDAGGGETRTVQFSVDWLNVRVRNLVSYDRPVSRTETTTISYPGEMPHQDVELPSQYQTIGPNGPTVEELPYPDPRVVTIGSFNLSAYGWLNSEGSDNIIRRRRQAANEDSGEPVGVQGRYYLNALSADRQDTVKFTHIVAVGGLEFGLDFANKRGRRSGANLNSRADALPTVDFKAGDKVILESFGGTLGLPLPGTKVRFKVNESIPDLADYTDEILEQVKVVPNPFFVTHLGQPTTDQTKIYFTHLPETCTISIYTINGDLIRKIEHDESLSGFAPGERGFELYDLLSDGRQRVGSQTLVAHVETPNGASSIVKFSVVTGGFRNVSR